LNFPFEDETKIHKNNFFEDIYNFFFEHFKYDMNEVRQSISDRKKIPIFLRRLEQHYISSINNNEIDESIFVREQTMLTPMKFSPFNSQANANYKYKNYSPFVDIGNINGQNIFNIDSNLNSITIKSRLCDTVEFPKIANNSPQAKYGESPNKKNMDSFWKFSEMYQWLKETVNDINLVEYGNIMVTEKLRQIFEQLNSKEPLKLMERTQNDLMDKLNKGKQQGSEGGKAQESLNKSMADVNLRFF